MRHLLALLLASLLLGVASTQAQPTQQVYLSGTGPHDAVAWDFKVSDGRRAGEWASIPVPSHWEQHGFGAYNYGHDWTNKRRPLATEVGHYRRTFEVPAAWDGQHVEIVFDGAMTDATVRINGTQAGPTHQGAFYRFRYAIGDLLRYGETNQIDVEVAKVSANASVNAAERQADFWIFGGLFRPVWLEVRPAEHIERIALDPKHTGAFAAEVFPRDVQQPAQLTAQVVTLDGEAVGPSMQAAVAPGDSVVVLREQIDGIMEWSPEWPELYRVVVTLARDGVPLHTHTERFGFRTVEVVPQDGIYVNGVKVHMKGVNRHSFWPETGRATTPQQSIDDVLLIKAMNMNAVRAAHYPPDKHFLDAADSLGLFVLNELTGWQDAYDDEAGPHLVRETVLRDVNHPSVIAWNNGNEGGNNHALVPLYHRYDPQRRVVLHPWDNSGGIDTGHYRNWGCCGGQYLNGTDIVMPTEFLHGLYDGGHGAGLEDWWRTMLHTPHAAGGFLWVFADEALRRTDLGDTLDTDGNHGADGILGPHREKEGSFHAIKEIWSPIYIPLAERTTLPTSFDGRIRVENRYYFTDLNAVQFDWQLVRFDGLGGRVLEISPGQNRRTRALPWRSTHLDLLLPEDWDTYDVLYLRATDPHGRAVFTWSWMTRPPDAAPYLRPAADGATAVATETDTHIRLSSSGTTALIDRSSGMLTRVEHDGQPISLANGPRLVADSSYTLTDIALHTDGGNPTVEATYEGDLRTVRWTMHPGGWLELAYQYGHGGEQDFIGITFDYPEAKVTSAMWLGRGPYRVWKNRTKGQRLGVHTKAYNDAVTGLTWDYPEFKGYHADLYWATLETEEAPITIAADTPGLYLRLFTPRQPGAPGSPSEPRFTQAPFPAGDLSILHAIPAIGTKFRPAERTGPSGRANQTNRHYKDPHKFDYRGRLFFRFGDPERD
ncbi:MAG: glycoside hydrolase family 2 TIM barrel-domain containing protein [Bacteroidota bacterium]